MLEHDVRDSLADIVIVDLSTVGDVELLPLTPDPRVWVSPYEGGACAGRSVTGEGGGVPLIYDKKILGLDSGHRCPPPLLGKA
jgi:hypothetical protein|eukprot:COSAG01_NODE_3095_length_6592_cov_88.338980_8_plen_83_part_00